MEVRSPGSAESTDRADLLCLENFFAAKQWSISRTIVSLIKYIETMSPELFLLSSDKPCCQAKFIMWLTTARFDKVSVIGGWRNDCIVRQREWGHQPKKRVNGG